MNKIINNDIPQLTPIMHSWVNLLLEKKDLLHEELCKYGSPLNIHCLSPYEENLIKYRSVFERLDLSHKIYFARKANKCIVYAQRSTEMGEGVDTASFNELQQCLGRGIAGENLLLTAAVKNKELLELAVKNGVTVVLDNMDEVELLQSIAEKQKKRVPVNVRVGGFGIGTKRMHTRFGFSGAQAMQIVRGLSPSESWLEYKGLHFHLNGYSIEERAIAIEGCIEIVDGLRQVGIETFSLDIGGGFLMNYLESRYEWENFHNELKQAVLGAREEVTYMNDPLGMVKIDNRIYGEPTVYPYYNEINGARFLEAILEYQSKKYNDSLSNLIVDRGLEIHMEPGRSMLDQCGVTIAKVAFRKEDSIGNLLIGLEMNRTQLRSSSADFLLDPIHLPMQGYSNDATSCHGYLVGSYCLEQELILKRKISFKQFPEVGDLIVFCNTAGYMMHFYESQAHQFDLAKNLLFDVKAESLELIGAE